VREYVQQNKGKEHTRMDMSMDDDAEVANGYYVNDNSHQTKLFYGCKLTYLLYLQFSYELSLHAASLSIIC
jgi:hypothetical protein